MSKVIATLLLVGLANTSGLSSSSSRPVIVGTGLSGLCCGSLLSLRPDHPKPLLLESHSIPGGCLHTWSRKTKQGTFHFESGPSLYSGLSQAESHNPLRNVFQIIGKSPNVLTYDRWGTVFPDGKKLAAPIGPEGFNDVLMAEYGTPTGQKEWDGIMERMREVGEASQALTSMSLREDAGVLLTAAARYPLGFIKTLRYGQQLTRPFSDIQEELSISGE